MVLTIFLWLISWWNVENLFDTHHDSLSNDLEYTVDGSRHWSYTRYKRKIENTARVICNIGGWEHVAVMGLGEVENDYCLRSLCYTMYPYRYRYIHYDSPDERGVDVALLYDPAQFLPFDSAALTVNLDGDRTRDILYVAGTMLPMGDTLYTLTCHLPSMRGGKAASDWKRQVARSVVQHKVDSILGLHPQAQIVVMGDMNSAPQEDIAGLHNQMIELERDGQGTHYYQGRWSCLDQFYLSSSLADLAHFAHLALSIYHPSWMLVPSKDGLDSIPSRTYNGYRYNKNGYSDHLPIVLQIDKSK